MSRANTAVWSNDIETSPESPYAVNEFPLPKENRPQEGTADIPKQIEPPKPYLRVIILDKKQPFRVLQKWEGRVLQVSADDFTAIVTDKTNPSNDDEEIVFDIEDVSDDDRELVAPGAVFYWSIGYDDSSGSRRRVSQIRFRRLPGMSSREIKEAEKKALEFASIFK
jgi:hypothetical protein